MNSKNYLGIIGVALLFAGSFSPMLKLPIIGTWNYWKIEPVLASIVYLLGTLALFASFSGRTAVLRFSGWASLVLVLFTLAAVYFQVRDSFSFIPLKKLAGLAAGLVKYQWLGWGMLILGSVIIILAGRAKPRTV